MIDPRQVEVKNALREFLRAFENCDLPAMDRLFAPDCVSFDQVEDAPVQTAVYRVQPANGVLVLES